MKKLVLTSMIAIMLFAFTNAAQADTYGKKYYAAVNPLGLIFHIYSGEFGMFLDSEGAAEINIPIYATIWDWFNAYGIGAKYRMYKDGNGEGIFYGGGLKLNMITWDRHGSGLYWNGNSWVEDDDATSNWMTITPLGEAGYRWTWSNGWTVAPSLELGFDISTYDGDDGWGDPDMGATGVHWSLNLGVAYMFNM